MYHATILKINVNRDTKNFFSIIHDKKKFVSQVKK